MGIIMNIQNLVGWFWGFFCCRCFPPPQTFQIQELGSGYWFWIQPSSPPLPNSWLFCLRISFEKWGLVAKFGFQSGFQILSKVRQFPVCLLAHFGKHVDWDSNLAGVPTVACLLLRARVWFGCFSGSLAKNVRSHLTQKSPAGAWTRETGK